MKFFKKIIFLVLLVTYYLIFVTPIYASDEFDTLYKTTYTVQPDASVKVEQRITLTNKLTDIYATQYSLSLGTTKIKEIWAKDDFGNISPQVEKKENLTNIKLEFNDRVVGKYKTLNFTLGYISDDYASKNGRVLEIGIPKIVDSQVLKDHQIILQVPTLFEKPIFILPKPKHSRQENNFNIYSFTKEQLVDKSIIASFGESQIFDFKLAYHLENDKNTEVYFEVAFPPDTSFQKVYYENISPAPENIFIDQDGNWLGKYLINPNSTLDIIAIGSAEIFIQPETEVKEQKLDDPALYLKNLMYWETDNEQIKTLANELKTVKNIYDYVINNISYDYEKVNKGPQRLGALKVLNNKNSAVCMEFTDLFIALCRAAGIPAREVNGYAYADNPKLRPFSLSQDILHAWPEYYDNEKKLWIGVDPTWENTAGIDFFSQIGLNHFGFVFHGVDSTYPYTPGSYKAWLQKTKDVEVSFGEKPVKKEKFSLELDFPKKVLAGTKIKAKVKIKNLGNTAIYEQGFDPIPPFSFYEKELVLGQTNIFDRKKVKLDFEFKDQKKSGEIEVGLPLIFYFLTYGIGTILGLGIFMVLLKVMLASSWT